MATYVLVHGGSHGGWCYGPLARRLRAAGHDVHTPSLTGLGERTHLVHPGVDLDLHVRDVAALLHYEDLHDAILVGHSYGGMVITGAADRAIDRVGHLVYLDAALPRSGEALVDLAKPLMDAALATMQVIDGVELVLFPGTGPMPTYGVTDPATVTWMMERLAPHPWRCFTQPLVLADEAAVLRIPQTHIVCTSTLPYRDRERMQPALDAGRVWDVDTGHDLMITEPDRVAELLLRLA